MDETEDEITLQEALETQEMLENQSVAVLGASDPQNCSYPKGYMKRQALYACLTCNPKGAPFSKDAGVCLACSYTCHEGHELVELFTKRHFRCDCGNKNFPDNPCRLQPEKDEFNVNNSYNQNFKGVYCTCHRPYPDPEADSEAPEDSMIQCIICEDWLHFKHCLAYLNMDFDGIEDDFELICGPCMSRLDFLGHYSDLAVKQSATKRSDTCEAVPVQEVSAIGNEETSSRNEVNTKPHNEDSSSQDSGIDSVSENDSSSEVACWLKKHPKESLSGTDLQAVAWKESLRSKLCTCATCKEMYDKLKITFLLDPEDTIEHYEALGKKFTDDAKQNAEASINNQVESLGRVGQIEFLHGYNNLKEQLTDFLKRHAENGTVVQREDVQEFFAKMNEDLAAKRRRLE